jgi:DNA invertase Pin-like site-specific DNA recombinase
MEELLNVGYARVSTRDQDLELQRAALKEAGCEKIFEEKGSGGDAGRPELARALEWCREGDVLVVWKLDRLGRSLKDLIDRVGELEERGIGFKSITESLDTTTPGGRLVFHVFGALAQFERELIRERTMAGLKAARARGRKGGRPKKMDEKTVALARELLSNQERTVEEVCGILGVGRTTLYRALGPGGTGPARFASADGGS